MTNEPDIDRELDCEGLLCPLPVLRAAKALRGMAPGSLLRVRATDKMAAIDLPHYCSQTGHSYLGAEPAGGGPSGPVSAYLIRRGPDRDLPETD